MGCIYTIILVPRRNVYVLFECWDCFQSTKPSSAIFRLCCCLGDAETCRLSCPGDSVLTAVLVIFHVTFVGWSCSALRSGPAASHKQPSRSLDHQPKKQTRNKVKTVFNAKKHRETLQESLFLIPTYLVGIGSFIILRTHGIRPTALPFYFSNATR